MNVPLDTRFCLLLLWAAHGAARERVPPMAGKRKGFGLRWKHCRAARSVRKRTKIGGNNVADNVDRAAGPSTKYQAA
jgi:hypothetical protein